MLGRMATTNVPARPPLADPTARLQFLPGVAPLRPQLSENLGLLPLEHLARPSPRDYLAARRFVAIRDLQPGSVLTVFGQVRAAAAQRTRRGRTDFTVRVADSTGTVVCHFF